MNTKDYIKAAEIVRERYRMVKASSSGVALGILTYEARAVEEAFVQLFRGGLFNEDKFREACKVK